MKIALFSNYLNHHQLPFCTKMNELTNNQFFFVATSRVSPERLKLGYHDGNKEFPFVVSTYSSKEKTQHSLKLALESDVGITGSAPEIYTKVRMERDLLTFRYSERIYKRGIWRVISPRGLRNMMKLHRKYRRKPLYMLCASGYTAYDYSLTGNYIDKTYKWGYFTDVKNYNLDELFAQKSEGAELSILWVARYIPYKHPEAPIQVAKHLKKKGYAFNMNLIGTGEMESRIREMISENQLNNHVHLLGSMSPEEVREHMEQADIFLFTSDFNEGWGAVLNEAMNSGCAVVASHAIGSVPFLIENGKNGLIYKNGNTKQLCELVEKLIRNPELRRELGTNAYKTITELWNAEVAAERLLVLIKELQEKGSCDVFESGPCSRAEIIKNGWFK